MPDVTLAAADHSPELDALQRRLLDEFQAGLPLRERPFAAMAATLGVSEDAVIDGLAGLRGQGCISRVGAVVEPRRVGASTLAAMAVPADRLDEVAALVSAYDEVNHNYERSHRYNLWFVVTAANAERVQAVLAGIARRSGCAVLDLPLLEAFHIDLGFPLQWT
jgi:siroheme decarboxylase